MAPQKRDSSDDAENPDRDPTPEPNPNVFDDEYALGPDEDDSNDFIIPVADGFRPAGMTPGAHGNNDDPSSNNAHDNDRSKPPQRAESPADGDLRRLASRNSVIKGFGARNSISQDGRNRGPVPHAAAVRRHASISSTASFVTTSASDSTYTPSHPYGLYHQNTTARTASLSTSSTARPPLPSPPLNGPSHPYALYPQNIIENESPVSPVAPAIPVGFPGLNASYHRQIGPDGEEQDIVGPDGHTEQLPPYTRYPESGPTKAALAAEASAAQAAMNGLPLPDPPDDAMLRSPPGAPGSPASPVSPLSLITPAHDFPPPRQEIESRDSSQPSVGPHQAATTSSTALGTTERGASEKQEKGAYATPWHKKRLWGKIPLGIIALLAAILAIIIIVLGTAIGTLKDRKEQKSDQDGPKDDGDKHKDHPSPVVTGPRNSLFGATPIATPANMPSLPTGSFALPLGIAQESSKNCLTVADQLSAWSCKMTFAPLVLSVDYSEAETPEPAASVGPMPRPDRSILYGIQPPDLGVQEMQLVSDLDYKVYGPAYHFWTRYDKLVVLREDEFVAGANLEPAGGRGEDKPPFKHRFQVMPGDSPWYCFWNQTYMEGYIYVQDNSTAATFTNFPTAWPSIPADIASATPVTPAPTSSSTATATESQSTSSASPGPSRRVARRGDSAGYPRYAPYPRIVKIEERRLPGSPPPYCQKMKLLDDFNLVAALDYSNYPIKVRLDEEHPQFGEYFGPASDESEAEVAARAKALKRRVLDLMERGDPPDACHCQWMFQ